MQNLNNRFKEGIDFEQGKYEVIPSNKMRYRGVDCFEFKNKKGDTYLILYSNNPPFQTQFYNGYKFKNYNLKVIQPDFGKLANGGLSQDVTNDRDSLNIYNTIGNSIIKVFKSKYSDSNINTITLYSIGARDIEPKKQKLYKKLVEKLTDHIDSINLGIKEVSYAGFDLKMNILIPKADYDLLKSKNELNELLSMLQLPLQENLVTYLSRELNISLKEAVLLEKEVKRYSLSKKKLEEVDLNNIKKAILTGAISIASLLSPLDASSDYFRMTSNTLNKSNLKDLTAKQKIELLQYAKSHLPKGDSDINRIDNAIKKLSSLKNRYTSRRSKPRLNEFDFIKAGKKAIATALLVSLSFGFIAQKLYGNDSCSIDSSGKVVSCDISKLQDKRPVSDLIPTVYQGIKYIKDNLDDKNYKYHEFTGDEIDAVKTKIIKLQARKDITPKESNELQGALKNVKELQDQLDNLNKKPKSKKKENLKFYLCKRLNISLTEASLIETELKNYIKIKGKE
jgi:hypothetical protein